MKAESGISYDNAAVASCPKHLLQFAVNDRQNKRSNTHHFVLVFNQVYID